MTPSAFVKTLRARGGALLLSDDGVKVQLRAPARIVTPRVTRYVEKRKPELLALLRAQQGGALLDPFADDGDDPPHVVFVRALLDEAQAGRLPVQTVTLPTGRTFADPNVAALDLARLCRLAAAVGRTEEADGDAADLLALVASWNERRTVYHDPARDGLTYAQAQDYRARARTT